jgi:4-amino-4-deoxy-L-arabinose transferase-like glycosyltransferase
VAASSGGLIAFSRGASFDILITMSITFALGCFLASELVKSEKERRWLLAGFWCSIGLSLLAKGLVGIVIPAGVVAAYFCLSRRWPDRLVMVSALRGAPLALLVSAVWYGPVIFRNGRPFIDQFFIQHHFARYLSNKYHHPQPIYFYIPVILALCLPWTAFVIEAVVKACKPHVWSGQSNNVAGKTLIFLIVWLIFPLAFFSLSGSKLPGYVLPALPAAVLLAGERLGDFVRQAGSSIAMRVTGLVLLILSPTGAFYAMHFGSVSMKCAALVTAPLLLAGAVATFLVQMRELAAVMIVIAILVAVQLSLVCAAPRFTERENVRRLISSAEQLGYQSAPLFMFEKVERSAEFYAAGRVAYGPDGEPVRFELVSQVVQQAGQTPGPILIILRPRAVSLFLNRKDVKAREIGTNGATSLIVLERK